MPSRLFFDLGATVDANGNATMGGGAGQAQPASSPSQGVISASLSNGTGVWSVNLTRGQGQPGSLLGTAVGASISTSFLIMPGEQVTVSVTGAVAGAGVVGSVLGTQGISGSSLPPLYAGGTQSTTVDATLSGPVPVENTTNGQLQTRINPSTTITAAAAQGSMTVDVVSSSYFQDADPVFLTTNVGASQQTTGLYFIDGLTPTSITFEQGIADAANPGDIVVLCPTVQVTQIGQQASAWQVPNEPFYSHFETWPAGTTNILNPTDNSYRFYLFGYSITITTGSSGVLFLSSTTSGQFTESISAPGAISGNLYGQTLGFGEGINVVNVGSAQAATVIFFYGEATY